MDSRSGDLHRVDSRSGAGMEDKDLVKELGRGLGGSVVEAFFLEMRRRRVAVEDCVDGYICSVSLYGARS